MAVGWTNDEDFGGAGATMLGDGLDGGTVSGWGGMTGGQPGTTGAEAMSIAGPVLAVFGAVSSAIGTYYQAEAQKDQLASQASSFLFKKSMSELNARRAASLAEYVQFAGAQKAGAYGIQAGQQRESLRASMAARGIQLGVGSAKETVVSFDTMKAINLMTMDANTMRAADDARTQQQNLLTQSMMEGVSASNLTMSAGTISPMGMAGTSLLGSAGAVTSAWYQNNLMNQLIARNKG